jgi:hypothetical protein
MRIDLPGLEECIAKERVLREVERTVVRAAKRWFAGDSAYSRELRDAVQQLLDLESQR